MRKHWIDGCFFPVLALVKHVHQHGFGESLCCLSPPGTCKPTFSPCIQLTFPVCPWPCTFSRDSLSGCSTVASTPEIWYNVQIHIVTCWKQIDELFHFSPLFKAPVCRREIAMVCADSSGPELWTSGQMLVLADISDMEQKLLECKSLSMNCRLKTYQWMVSAITFDYRFMGSICARKWSTADRCF